MHVAKNGHSGKMEAFTIATFFLDSLPAGIEILEIPLCAIIFTTFSYDAVENMTRHFITRGHHSAPMPGPQSQDGTEHHASNQEWHIQPDTY